MTDAPAGTEWLRSRRRLVPPPTPAQQSVRAFRRPTRGRRAAGVGVAGSNATREGSGTVPAYVPDGAEFDYEQARGYGPRDDARLYGTITETVWVFKDAFDHPSERDREAAIAPPEELEDWDLSPWGQPIRPHDVPGSSVDPATWCIEVPRSWRPTDEEWTPPPRPPVGRTGGLPYAPAPIPTARVVRRSDPARGWLAEARLAYRDAEIPEWAIRQAASLQERRGLRCHVGPDDAVLAFGRPPSPAPVPEADVDPVPPRKKAEKAKPPTPDRPGGPTPISELDECGAITPEAWNAFWTA